MDRPDLMYGVFDAAQICSKGEIIDAKMRNQKRKSRKQKMKKKKKGVKKRKMAFSTYPVFKFPKGRNERANNVKFSENEGRKEKSPIGHTGQNLILLKRRLGN